MCSDENGAPHAVRYLNAQLAVLHENAQKCLEEHDQARTEENSMLLSAFLFIMASVVDVTVQSTSTRWRSSQYTSLAVSTLPSMLRSGSPNSNFFAITMLSSTLASRQVV